MEKKFKLWNKTIFWKDITRFWPLWVIELILLQFCVTLPTYFGVLACKRDRNWKDESVIWEMQGVVRDSLWTAHSSLLVAIVSMVVALFVFQYVLKRRDAYTMHSLPVRREGLFLSHYCSGLVILAVPYTITYLIIIGVSFLYSLSMAPAILLCLVETLVMILFFYSLACVAIMLAGNGGMAAAVYVVLNMFYIVFKFLAGNLYTQFCYGAMYYDGDLTKSILEEVLTPLEFFGNRVGINGWQYNTGEVGVSEFSVYMKGFWEMMAFIVPALLLVGVALYLYKKRPVESAGDAVAFPWGKWAFRLVFSLFGSMIFATILYFICAGNVGDTYSYSENFKQIFILTIVGVVVCYSVSNMILEKTFFVWRKMPYLGMVIVLVLMSGILFGYRYSNASFDRPKTEKLRGVEIIFFQDSSEEAGYSRPHVYYIVDKEKIEALMKLEEEIRKLGREADVYQEDGEEIYVCYQMRSNMFQDEVVYYERSYPLPKDKTILKKMQEFINEPDTLCETLFGKEEEEFVSNYIALERYPTEASRGIDLVSTREALSKALIKDIQAGNVKAVGEEKHKKGYMMISPGREWNESMKSFTDYSESYDYYPDMYAIPITEKCTNVLDVMNELNLEF